MKKWRIFSALLLFSTVMFVDDLMSSRPTVGPPPDSPAIVDFLPVGITTDLPGWSVAGAWRLSSEDVRFTGLSSLAFDDGQLVTVTDYARLMRLTPPTVDGASQTIDLHVLTKADGYALRFRDTEALVFDEDRMWVAREGDHALLAYRRDGRVLQALQAIEADWPYNGGVEAIVPPSKDEPMLLISERQNEGLAVEAENLRPIAIAGVKGWPTDATRLADGRILLLSRALTPLGFRSWIAQAEFDGNTLRAGKAMRLPFKFRDNAEGITAVPLEDGATRLWMITDDNGSRYLRTLLIALDIEAGAIPAPPQQAP